MKRKAALIGLLFLLISLSGGFTQDNPFLTTEPAAKQKTSDMSYPGFFRKILIRINATQRRLYEKMADLTELTKNSKDPRALLILIGIAFLYGVVHALGPGHGKTIAVSYFLGKRVSPSKGLLMGGLIALLHAGSAIIIVLTVYLVIRNSYLTSLDNISRIIRIASYTFITLIGLYLLFTAVRNIRKEEYRDGARRKEKNGRPKGIFSVALAVGIVPCPGALLILLFSLSMGILATGILLALVMAAGMGLSISAVGIATILAREGLSRVVTEKARARRILQGVLRLLGALLIFFLGVFLLLGSLAFLL